MLYAFLKQNQKEILDMTEEKSLQLAGNLQSSIKLKKGLPIFYEQLLNVLLASRFNLVTDEDKLIDKHQMQKAAGQNNEAGVAAASGKPEIIKVAKSAGQHGKELLRLGYTLSHVVHAYGSMCQSITELANKKTIAISAHDFHELNYCLDIAIAGAITEFQKLQNRVDNEREVEQMGSLVHELRNALTTVNISLQMIESGTVGFKGSIGQVLKNGLKRIENLIDRSLLEVRLHIDPILKVETSLLVQVVDQILITAEAEAKLKNQTIENHIDSELLVSTDQEIFYSALSNIIQNAIKYTRQGGKIEIRGQMINQKIEIEVEDECGGKLENSDGSLFKPFVQKNENRKGLGLGLTIAQRGIKMENGLIETRNLPGKGCIFKITLPQAEVSHLALSELH
ncbi:MAG: sensor histidine kinase [Bacteriovoracaceae bacterium]